MNATEYQSLRTRIESRYAERLREIDAERDSDLAALHRVCEIAGFTPGTRDGEPPEVAVDESSGEPSRAISGIVKAAVSKVDPERPFTFRDIQEIIAQRWSPSATLSPNAITQVLRRFVEHGDLRIVEQGQGRRATTYARCPVTEPT